MWKEFSFPTDLSNLLFVKFVYFSHCLQSWFLGIVFLRLQSDLWQLQGVSLKPVSNSRLQRVDSPHFSSGRRSKVDVSKMLVRYHPWNSCPFIFLWVILQISTMSLPLQGDFDFNLGKFFFLGVLFPNSIRCRVGLSVFLPKGAALLYGWQELGILLEASRDWEPLQILQMMLALCTEAMRDTRCRTELLCVPEWCRRELEVSHNCCWSGVESEKFTIMPQTDQSPTIAGACVDVPSKRSSRSALSQEKQPCHFSK